MPAQSPVDQSTIRYALLPDGAFVAGDPPTGLTAYAYPGSINAEAARRDPERTAASMMARESSTPWRDAHPEHDLRTWAMLNGGQA